MKLSYKTSWISLLLLIPSVLGTSPGLDGKHLIVAAEHWPPYFIISGDLEHPVFSGIMSQVLNYLQTSINFTSTIVRPPDATWGAFDEESGRWGGMVGMVKRNEVDFALGPFTPTSGRWQVVDFTIPVGYGGIVAIVPFIPSGNDMTVIMRPFGWKLWICVLASPFIFLFSLALSDKVFHGNVKWWKRIDFILRSIFMDSSASLPVPRHHNKILTITCLLVFYILALAYTGTLTSMLSKPAEPNFIQSVEELVEQTEIKWIIEQGSALSNYGQHTAEGSTLRLFHDGAIQIKGHEKTIKMLKTGQFAHIADDITARKVIADEFESHGVCTFYLTAEPLLTGNQVMIFPKGSPYFDLINEKLQIMFEQGLIDTWMNAMLVNSSNCNSLRKVLSSYRKPVVRLSFHQMGIFFLVITFGLVLSVVGFIAEIMTAKY